MKPYDLPMCFPWNGFKPAGSIRSQQTLMILPITPLSAEPMVHRNRSRDLRSPVDARVDRTRSLAIRAEGTCARVQRILRELEEGRAARRLPPHAVHDASRGVRPPGGPGAGRDLAISIKRPGRVKSVDAARASISRSLFPQNRFEAARRFFCPYFPGFSSFRSRAVHRRRGALQARRVSVGLSAWRRT